LRDGNTKTQKLLTSTGDRANFDIIYFLVMNIKDYIVIHITLENKVLLLIRHEEDYKFVQKFILL
jgi:hypothetical protein